MQLTKRSSGTRQDNGAVLQTRGNGIPKRNCWKEIAGALLKHVLFTRTQAISYSIFQGSFQLIFALVMLNHYSSAKICKRILYLHRFLIFFNIYMYIYIYISTNIQSVWWQFPFIAWQLTVAMLLASPLCRFIFFLREKIVWKYICHLFEKTEM